MNFDDQDAAFTPKTTDETVEEAVQTTSRRGFLHTTGAATLSATAVALIAGCESMAQDSRMADKGKTAGDIAILDFGVKAENQAIAAYQIAAESGLVRNRAVLQTAILFQSHHKQHRDTLAGVLQKLGGTVPEAKSKAAYALEIGAAKLKNQRDVLELALDLEKNAANAYVGAVPKFGNSGLAKAAAQICADETMHWTVLATVLRKPLPPRAFSFTG